MKYFTIGMALTLVISVSVSSVKNVFSANELKKGQTVELEKNLKITALSNSIFVVVHEYPWPSNSLVAVMDNDEILLIDTPYTPNATKKLLQWIDSNFGNRTMKAIITHFHIDRLGGCGELQKRKIPIYGSDLTVQMLHERADKSRKTIVEWITDPEIKQELMKIKFIPPSVVFTAAKGLNLKFGNDSVVISYYGPGHSPDNVVAYLPQKKVVFAGCMIIEMGKNSTGNISDADLKEWRKSLLKIKADNDDTVIPGHGAVGDRTLITHTLEILSREIDKLKK